MLGSYQISLIGTCPNEGGSAALSEGMLGPPEMGSGHRDVVSDLRSSQLQIALRF